MSDIRPIHYNDDRGEQHTKYAVTVTDAAGQEYVHEFEPDDDGLGYLGDGTPPESAVEALRDHLDR
ncbi:MAG: hypothetical protein ABEH78_07980 [Haloferacaceae archaeon]